MDQLLIAIFYNAFDMDCHCRQYFVNVDDTVSQQVIYA